MLRPYPFVTAHHNDCVDDIAIGIDNVKTLPPAECWCSHLQDCFTPSSF
jgi:hypothetical protein